MSYEAHSETIGLHRVRVILDDDYHALSDHMGDEPVNVIGFEYNSGWRADTIYKGAKTRLPEHAALAIAGRNLPRLLDAFEGSGCEAERLKDGRHKLTGYYLERAHYYKTENALFDAANDAADAAYAAANAAANDAAADAEYKRQYDHLITLFS